MGTRLYDEFMKKLKVPPVQKLNKKQENHDIVIAIPLKGGSGVPLTYPFYSLLTLYFSNL
jgi:hypothetical protein